MTQLKLPPLDLEVLEKAAKEAAMKGALKEIDEYYTGYKSPFRKKISAELESKTVGFGLDLPDIVGLINQKLSQEVDRIANNSIAESFIPMVTRALTRIDGDVKFSDFLKEFIYIAKSDFDDGTLPQVTVEKDGTLWLRISISYTDYCNKSINYNLLFSSSDDGKDKYNVLSLPRTSAHGSFMETMELNSENVTLKLPFTRDSLSDGFTSYIAKLIISETSIIMDCDDFDEDWFEEEN